MKKICLWIGIILVTAAIIFISIGGIRKKTYNPAKPVATIQIEGYDKAIKVELDPQAAPNAVANFIKLANGGFYNNFKMTIDTDEIVSNKSNEKARLTNIVSGAQENYVYGIKGDFLGNNVKNYMKHEKGTITMLRDDFSYFGYVEQGYNSANSRFSIITSDKKDDYNGYYAGFGKVIEGMDVVDAIKASRVEESNEQTQTTDASKVEDEKEEKNVIIIKSISVETYGVDYGIPEYNNLEETLNNVNELCKQYFGSDYDSLFK